jgi:hypothetical protein
VEGLAVGVRGSPTSSARGTTWVGEDGSPGVPPWLWWVRRMALVLMRWLRTRSVGPGAAQLVRECKRPRSPSTLVILAKYLIVSTCKIAKFKFLLSKTMHFIQP